eukprot:TRINITY_DN62606_c0_g1_i1.p1 TRINITY_DN62606_c0_g1~~TRINITY_DN62606_c0_g1_i1.p1  ORF type:complete len:264 (-),score=20.64 TRINITY_DN62606_c0_g1_i1:47-838(-)
MPLWSVACTACSGSIIACLWAASASQPAMPPMRPWPSAGRCHTVLRLAFIVAIVSTMGWSLSALSDILVCSEGGDSCLRFTGGMQFSTFTRWCWMLQGFYYIVALVAAGPAPQLARLAQVLFEISLATALLVSFVTYTVLVPGALLVDQPSYRRGSVEILLSYQGHIMHSMNTVFIFTELTVCRPRCRVWLQDLPYGILFLLMYLVFEWIFHAKTGMWHYPFLDYNKAVAVPAHVMLLFTFVCFWHAGIRVTGSRTGSRTLSD